MGLKALFSKDGRKERALAKACAKAVNKKVKPDDRQPALAMLINDWKCIQPSGCGGDAQQNSEQKDPNQNIST